ncbi:hypothetical protein, partial [Serratia marcescens]|uniref:hypothetical protein n=1 Tax=Serratia marcescens TaxID=615 RepID=UPI001954A108
VLMRSIALAMGSGLESVGDTLTGYESWLTSLESLMNTAVSSYNSYIDLANAITKEQKKLLE